MIKIIKNFFFFPLSLFFLFQFFIALSFLYISDEVSDEKTDAIVVFTGGSNRIATALDLFQNHAASKLYISGLNPKTSIYQILNKLNIKDLDSQSIFFDYAKNTEENAIETAKWVKINHIKSIRLVTSHLHMSRSYFLLSSELRHVKIIPHKVEMNENKENSIAFLSYGEEFLKFEVTLIRKIEELMKELYFSFFEKIDTSISKKNIS